MAEQFRPNEQQTTFTSRGPFRPEAYPNMVMGYEPSELASLGRETAQAVEAVLEARKPVASSWAGGGNPKTEYMAMWTERATKELLGLPTNKPYAEYFEASPERVTSGSMVPNQEVTLTPSQRV